EAARLKRQLAEQDAQINKLRKDQQADAAGVDANAKQQEMEAATPQDQPTAAVAKQQEQEAAMPQDQPTAAVAKQQEQEAAMPQDQATAAAATQRPASPVAATKADDAIAVFPSNSSAADNRAADNRASRPDAQRPIERSVYFDFDQSRVAKKYDSMLVTNAAYIKAHPDLQTEVQGNCDERGSREYNLALGARRAEAVKRALKLAGANGSSISAISFGAEKPVATSKDEESYSKNRRADIVY
ncbi:MAG: peptidoglycan-associated lipoprotein Pal, partial [Betaproteobacteria bacterium]